MSRVFTFNETVRGHLHVMNGFPCEDSSSSFSAENNRYHIAIIADGHGAKSCFRSEYGSKVASEVAMECLQQFAETTLVLEETEERFYKDIFSNPRYRQMTIKQLTDTILAKWHDRVLENYKNEPPTIEEMGDSVTEYQNGKNPLHIYGTTLLAALQMPGCLILLHQGDGRCDVFYEDGLVDQPIPWDPRCEDTTTTSLCDEDAGNSFRSCVINTSERPVTACFVGSDGVEDAYRDTYEGLGNSHVLMGGVHTFYKYLICQISKLTQEEFVAWLPVFLEEFSADGIFSRTGSGDDVSVAGILDLDKISAFTDKYGKDVKLYALEEALFWKEDELRGKTRKHGILKKRYEEARHAFEDAASTQETLENELVRMKKTRDEIEQGVEEAKRDLDAYRQEAEEAPEQIENKYANLKSVMQRIREEISDGYSRKEAIYKKKKKHLLEYDTIIRQAEEKVNRGADQLQDLRAKNDAAKEAYEEYDSKYRAIEAERAKIEKEISDLQEGNM